MKSRQTSPTEARRRMIRSNRMERRALQRACRYQAMIQAALTAKATGPIQGESSQGESSPRESNSMGPSQDHWSFHVIGASLGELANNNMNAIRNLLLIICVEIDMSWKIRLDQFVKKRSCLTTSCF